MSLGLLIFLGLYILSTSWYLDSEIKRDLEQKLTDINVNFQGLLEQRAQAMHVQLEYLAADEELQRLMLARDREQLQEKAKISFKRLFTLLKISHFYFHTPNQKVFLRVHNPALYGDFISRHSLQKAAATQQKAYGIELGPLGTFTLRTVIPWYQEEKLLGYLELGEDIELLINNFFHQENTILTLTINKRFLDKEKWAVGMKMLGKDPATWDLLPDKVIALPPPPSLLPLIIENLNKAPRAPDDRWKINVDGKKFQGKLQTLRDSAGRYIGDFVVLRDVTVTMDEYWTTVMAFIGLCLLAAGGVLFSTAIQLGKTEAQLYETDLQLHDQISKVHNSNQQLEYEIEERKTAEAALNKIHDELEERVIERTEQLWLSLEQIQQVRKQLTDIVTSVPDGLLVTDMDNRVLLINQRAEELFNCTLDDCAGESIKTIIHDPALSGKMEETLQQQLNDFRFNVSIIAADLKSPISLQVRTSALTDKRGQTIGMIFLLHDNSKEREIDRIKSEFITTAVHELSTPLTAILGFSEFLLNNPELGKNEKEEFLSIINEKADFLSGLVGELLDISRIESGKPLELQKELHAATELFERPIQHLLQLSSGHRFEIDLQTPNTKLLVDKEKIWQVMENLCSNAVKYSPVGGRVKITGRLTANDYRVTVSDQGIGMTQEQCVNVFEKFYRCNQTDTSVGGTGLGLTIVKHIIESHDGQIWIDSELGQGTQVNFELPIQH